MSKEQIAMLEQALAHARMESEILRECIAKVREFTVNMVGQVVACSKMYSEEVRPLLENREKMDAEIDRRIEDRQRRIETSNATQDEVDSGNGVDEKGSNDC